jgi:hypothetical protein
MTPPPRLGIDIGRVIIRGFDHFESDPSGHDTPFVHVTKMTDEANLKVPPMGGIWEYIPELVTFFRARGGDVWLVSKAKSARTRELTLKWLEYHDFWARTGISSGHLIFTETRADKTGVARNLGLTHFVDDRVDVLRHMLGQVPVRVLFGKQDDASLEWARDNETLHAHDWAQTAQQLKWPEQYLPLRPNPP